MIICRTHIGFGSPNKQDSQKAHGAPLGPDDAGGILKDLGLRRLRLLTNNPKKIVGLESYSLEVVEQIPLTRPRVQRRQGTAS